MQELHVAARDAGQRFDKFLARYMSGAPKSFFLQNAPKEKYRAQRQKSRGQ